MQGRRRETNCGEEQKDPRHYTIQEQRGGIETTETRVYRTNVKGGIGDLGQSTSHWLFFLSSHAKIAILILGRTVRFELLILRF